MSTRVLKTVAGVIVAASLGLAGCGTDNTANNTSSSSTNQTATTAANTTKTDKNISLKTNVNSSTTVTLSPSKDSKVNGTATLTLDPKTHELTVVVKASGLAPNSVHPVHIDSGTTAKPGAEVYALANLTADKNGDATSTTVIKGVKNIPATGWVILIYQGPKDLKVLASGDVKTITKK